MLEGTVAITTSLTSNNIADIPDGIFVITIVGQDDVNRGYITPSYSRNREGVFEARTEPVVYYPTTSSSCRATSWVSLFEA